MAKIFRIRCKNAPWLFWSNTFGWVSGRAKGFTIFTEKESKNLNLPIEGEWELYEAN